MSSIFLKYRIYRENVQSRPSLSLSTTVVQEFNIRILYVAGPTILRIIFMRFTTGRRCEHRNGETVGQPVESGQQARNCRQIIGGRYRCTTYLR